MKFFVALVLAVACASADVAHLARTGESAASILRSDVDTRPDGYSYFVETDNGIHAVANAVLKNVNAENPAQEVTGEYSYTAPDGVTYVVKYVANENGFQPEGAHLPTPPPTPEAILRSLAYQAANPQVEAKVYAPVPRPAVQSYVAPAFPAPARPFQKANKFARF